MVKLPVITIALALAATSASAQQTPPQPQPAAPAAPALPDSPAAWRAAAERDLKAAHDILRDNSPAPVVDRDSGPFRAWIDTGLASSLKLAEKVKDGYGYVFVMRRYLRGFHDGHIGFGESFHIVLSPPKAWTGYVLGLRGNDYKVVYRGAGVSDGPPIGAVFAGCDGQSAETFAQNRDLYDADRVTYSGRFHAAYFMMFDRANPFVTLPRSCTFRVAGKANTYPVQWRPMPQAEVEPAYGRAVGAVHHTLAVEPWGDNWWITVPSMEDNLDWDGFAKAIEAHKDAIRAAGRVVIDLRGNGGGSSTHAYDLAAKLWGQDWVDARQPSWGPEVWRASPINLDNARHVRDELVKDGLSGNDLADYDKMIASMDAAIKAGKPTVTDNDGPDATHADPAVNPMKGKVILLTDSNCFSACLDLMDLFMRLPNTVQAGSPTGADTIFMELTPNVKLPSGLGAISFGHKAWVKRIRGSNVAYTPAPERTWTGEPDDEAGLRAWLGTL